LQGIGRFKSHLEFLALEMDKGWETPPGYPDGIEQKIISGRLDEDKKRGIRTRLLRFQPNARSTEQFVHEYWEEVLLISGDLIVGSAAGENGEETFEPFTYACRPPGVHHGPFRSEGGCLLVEIHYYEDSEASD
jgi:acetoin utilization deacetylase AcuC-like enzyme